MNRFAVLLVATLTALPLAPRLLRAQIGVGVRYGEGDGSAKYNVGEINARARATGAIYVTGMYQILGGHWSCPGGDVAELRCDYDGHSISLGAAYAAIDDTNVYFAVGGAVGGFLRTGGRTYSGDRHFTGNVSADADVRLWGPLRVQLGVAHRRIFDDTYSAAFDTSPNLTSLTAGVSLVFGSN